MKRKGLVRGEKKNQNNKKKNITNMMGSKCKTVRGD